MRANILIILILLLALQTEAQENAARSLLADSSMQRASVSICILDAITGESVFEINPDLLLAPASVLKLVVSAAALELLGPEYSFSTTLGYNGSLNKHSGELNGNIIIRGGGDPALGSDYFQDHYKDFLLNWIKTISKSGIKKIEGRVITDDSRYDYQPVPGKWLWEDAGNYYGAGVYGLSVFDNTYEIHFRTGNQGSLPEILRFDPEICRYDISNYLQAYGKSDKGYVFSAPYSTNGWISGTIPENRNDFILKASINDPPLLLAKIFTGMLDSAGISVSEMSSTVRTESIVPDQKLEVLSEVSSPPLRDLIEILNHESVNLYAENLLKELGKVFLNSGTTSSGIEIVYRFLKESGINTSGILLEDGSGLSPLDAITSRELSMVLFKMKKDSKYFPDFIRSLPDAGREGTLKNYFRDPLFDSNLKAKSGSMTRIRSYAGYFSTRSGRERIFSIIVNNFSGTSQTIVSGIETILKEAILQ